MGNYARGSGESNYQGQYSSYSLGSKNEKDPTKGSDERSIHHTLSTIVGGFSKGGETSPSRKEHAHQALDVDGSPIDSEAGESEALYAKITFLKRDAIDIHPHNDAYIFIIIRCDDCEIK